MSARPSTAIAIIGLGPAGRIAAYRAAARGWSVTAFDPAPALPSTVGAWRSQLPPWAPDALVQSSFFPTVVLHDGRTRRLAEQYVVLNTELMASWSCGDERRCAVTAEEATAFSGAAKVLDATAGGPDRGIRQLAVGHIFDVRDLPATVRNPVMMDFRHPDHSDPNGSENNCRQWPTSREFPCSFSYRIPLGSTRFLIEETFLAVNVAARGNTADEAALLAELRRRQRSRLEKLGVFATPLQEEIVSFPLVPHDAFRSHRAVGFGGGWLHPATGYSVGAVLNGIDSALSQMENGLPIRPPGGKMLYELRLRGLAAILTFTPMETAQFFSAFFQLDQRHIHAYLVGDSLRGVLAAMGCVAKPLVAHNPRLAAKLIWGFCSGL